MSANNQLVIEKVKGGFRISNIDIDNGGGFFLRDHPYRTLEQAVKAANKYMQDEEVEYGINIVL